MHSNSAVVLAVVLAVALASITSCRAKARSSDHNICNGYYMSNEGLSEPT